MVRVTKWQVQIWMIRYISILVTHSLLITLKYRQYSAIADLHTFQFTVAHALGFSVSTSCLLATDLSTETSTQITTSMTHKILQLHFKSSQTDLLFSSELLVSIRSASLRLLLVTPLNISRLSLCSRGTGHGKHTSRDHQSLLLRDVTAGALHTNGPSADIVTTSRDIQDGVTDVIGGRENKSRDR
jgi:hypothetical protein